MRIDKLFKKIVFFNITLIIVMNCFTFAAIVSDNDGSAFVTKAEFDALKSSFNKQIDSYNESLDSKIDGAIASYLSGIQLTTIENEKLIFNDFDSIACYNGSVAPTFTQPDVNISYGGASIRIPSDWGGGSGNKGFMTTCLGFNWKAKYYDTSRTNKNVRPLVSGNNEAATDQSANMYWNGIAYDYKERYDLFRAWSGDNWVFGWLDAPLNILTSSIKLQNVTDILLNGYYPDFSKEKGTVVNPSVYWTYTRSGGSGSDKISMDGYEYGIINSSSVELLKNTTSGNTTYNNYIIQYDGATTWNVSNLDFLSTFRKHASNTMKSKDLLNKTTKSYKLNWMGSNMHHNTQSAHTGTVSFDVSQIAMDPQLVAKQNQPITVEDTVNTIMPSIGMLSSDQAANKIKQFKDPVTSTFKKSSIVVNPPTLEKGFPLFYCEKDVICKWSPKFLNGLMLNSSNNWVNDTTNTLHKVKLVLSLGPFDNKEVTSNVIRTQIDGSPSSSGNFQSIPVNISTTLSFVMPSTGVVYAKWWPDVTDASSYKWCYSLDLPNCNQWQYYNET